MFNLSKKRILFLVVIVVILISLGLATLFVVNNEVPCQEFFNEFNECPRICHEDHETVDPELPTGTGVAIKIICRKGSNISLVNEIFYTIKWNLELKLRELLEDSEK